MAMSDLNVVMFTGTVKGDLVLKQGKSGEYLPFTVEIERSYQNKEKEWVSQPARLNLILFGKKALNMAKYSGNECKVLVEAELKSNEVTNEKGTRHYMELQVKQVRFLTFREREDSQETEGSGKDDFSQVNKGTDGEDYNF